MRKVALSHRLVVIESCDWAVVSFEGLVNPGLVPVSEGRVECSLLTSYQKTIHLDMLSQPQDTLELQQKTKTVAVTTMSFALGEVRIAL